MDSSFFGVIVPDNKEIPAQVPAGCSLRLTQIALPANSNGKATVFANVDGKLFAVGTLDAAHAVYQFNVDLCFGVGQKILLSVKGNTAVHVAGSVMMDADDDLDMVDDEDDEEDEEDEDMPPVPKAQVAKTSPKHAPAAVPTAMDDDDEEDEEFEEEEEDEEGLDLDDLPSDLDMDGLDEELEEDEEEEEEEEEEPAAPAGRGGNMMRGRGFGARGALSGRGRR